MKVQPKVAEQGANTGLMQFSWIGSGHPRSERHERTAARLCPIRQERARMNKNLTVDRSCRSSLPGQTFGALICARSNHGSVPATEVPRLASPDLAVTADERHQDDATGSRQSKACRAAGCLSSVSDRSSPPLKRGPLKRSQGSWTSGHRSEPWAGRLCRIPRERLPTQSSGS